MYSLKSPFNRSATLDILIVWSWSLPHPQHSLISAACDLYHFLLLLHFCIPRHSDICLYYLPARLKCHVTVSSPAKCTDLMQSKH